MHKKFPQGLQLPQCFRIISFTIYEEENQSKYFKLLKKEAMILRECGHSCTHSPHIRPLAKCCKAASGASI